MMTMMATLQGHTSFILHSAGILDSFSAMSYEKFAADLEVIKAARKYCGGIEATDAELAVEEIVETGIGGNYLSSEHTFEHFRDWMWVSGLNANRRTEQNSEQAAKQAIQKTIDEMLEQYQAPDFDKTIDRQLKQYLKTEVGIEI